MREAGCLRNQQVAEPRIRMNLPIVAKVQNPNQPTLSKASHSFPASHSDMLSRALNIVRQRTFGLAAPVLARKPIFYPTHFYSSHAGLTKELISERVLELLGCFDKIEPEKVTNNMPVVNPKVERIRPFHQRPLPGQSRYRRDHLGGRGGVSDRNTRS